MELKIYANIISKINDILRNEENNNKIMKLCKDELDNFYILKKAEEDVKVELISEHIGIKGKEVNIALRSYLIKTGFAISPYILGFKGCEVLMAVIDKVIENGDTKYLCVRVRFNKLSLNQIDNGYLAKVLNDKLFNQKFADIAGKLILVRPCEIISIYEDERSI